MHLSIYKTNTLQGKKEAPGRQKVFFPRLIEIDGHIKLYNLRCTGDGLKLYILKWLPR